MKIPLLLSLVFSSGNLIAQEFKPATDEQLLALSMIMLEDADEIISSVPKEDCNKNMSVAVVEKKIEPSEPKEEIFCLCEIDPSKENNMLYSLIGNVESSELTINTGNDNLLHGVFQMTDFKKYDGDDRGRTFSGNANYSLIGSEGELRLNLDSTGFGKFSSLNGYTRTSDGKRYLNFREVNTLGLRLDKYISKSDSGKDYFISEFKFTNETDEGKFSRSAQEWWHSFNQNTLGNNTIQYKYLSQEDMQNTATVMFGAGRDWVSNLGNWKCQTRLEAKGGMSVNFSGAVSPEVAVRAENKISHSLVPWMALSSWLEAGHGFKGNTAEGGIMLTFEKKVKGVSIKPFIGIERHVTQMDKKYGSVSGNKPYENYHVFGVTIKY